MCLYFEYLTPYSFFNQCINFALKQLFVEMEQMASRPFAGVVLQMKNQRVNGSLSSNPTPIALEPCHGGKAAILTLVVKLPSGGQQVPPSGLPSCVGFSDRLLLTSFSSRSNWNSFGLCLGQPGKCHFGTKL